MNNNRNNNRRRGRGNRKQGGNGGGNQGNRIDSRARGNAPQLLDKYKKLAQDAQHNGDRVQAEYYLQFADHYFRVIADNNLRRDEQRGPSQRRWDEDGDDSEDEGFEEAAEHSRRRRDRDDRSDRGDEGEQGNEAADGGSDDEYEPVGNPFLRRDRDRDAEREQGRDGNERGARGERGDRGERSERKPRGRKPAAAANGEFDHSVLPPAIGRRAENDTGEDASAEDKPAPRRRRRKAGEDSAVAAE